MNSVNMRCTSTGSRMPSDDMTIQNWRGPTVPFCSSRAICSKDSCSLQSPSIEMSMAFCACCTSCHLERSASFSFWPLSFWNMIVYERAYLIFEPDDWLLCVGCPRWLVRNERPPTAMKLVERSLLERKVYCGSESSRSAASSESEPRRSPVATAAGVAACADGVAIAARSAALLLLDGSSPGCFSSATSSSIGFEKPHALAPGPSPEVKRLWIE